MGEVRVWVLGCLMLTGVLVSSCRDKHETDSYLLVELLQREQLLHWYTVEQREILRQKIEHTLRNK